ncbi:PXMP2/4 family protein 3-like [Chironomus tepperi]|uniref:PXMP2/4 family protein 3-like n=1 Tax=Chironomus tepperi TaxID=113505 RepID=UPI00391F1197
MISHVSKLFRSYPILKGMAVYSVIWPASSVVQQLIAKEKINYNQVFRFWLFGTFFDATLLYGWVRLSSQMWASMSLRSGITKAVVEQFSYSPLAAISFFSIMSLMEGKSFKEARQEVVEKFPQTYSAAIVFWPVIQTINYAFMKESNRVPFVAVVSFFWTLFLAYMKQLETGNKLEDVVKVQGELTEELVAEKKVDAA